MAKVTGIGGIFFKVAGDKTALAEWYRDNLGLELEPWGGAILRWPADTAEDGGLTVPEGLEASRLPRLIGREEVRRLRACREQHGLPALLSTTARRDPDRQREHRLIGSHQRM